MQDVTNRFLMFYEHLFNTGKVTSNYDFVKKTDSSPSIITEITKGRTNVGLKLLQNTVNLFPQLNVNWVLTGEGEMLKNSNIKSAPKTTPNRKKPLKEYNNEYINTSISEREENYKSTIQLKDEIIESKKEIIASQQITIESLKDQLAALKAAQK